MKLKSTLLFIFWMLVLMAPMLAIGQDLDETPNETFGPLKEIADLVFSPYFVDVASASGVIILIVPFVIAGLNLNAIKNDRSRSIAKQAVSWATGLVISFVAMFAGWGIFAELGWLQVILLTFIVGVQANLVQSTPIIKAITDAIEKVLNSESYHRKEIQKSRS